MQVLISIDIIKQKLAC